MTRERKGPCETILLHRREPIPTVTRTRWDRIILYNPALVPLVLLLLLVGLEGWRDREGEEEVKVHCFWIRSGEDGQVGCRRCRERV